MKLTSILIGIIVACALSVNADITGISGVTAIDLTDGVRVAAKIERIAYSPKWITADAGAVAEVTVNGEAVSSSSVAGTYEWTPTRNGTYLLSHVVKVGGEAVGDTLTATFVFSGLDAIPDLGANPTDAEVASVISGSEDARLSLYITNGMQYVAYRTWATNVQLVAGGLAGTQAVHDSPHAWLSYALDSTVLVANAPVQGEMMIASFEKNAETGRFDFEVSVTGINVGDKTTAEKLTTLFSVQGCETVNGDYSVDNVDFTFGVPVDGKVVISALPADKTATQFFMKVKMKP